MGDTDIVPVSRLIALVRQRPVLWDRQQEVYKNRKLTRKAWTEICEDLIDGYDGLTDSEKKATGKNVIGKWANLRDNWLRYWRKRQELLRIGSPTKSLKKYIHHDQLLFLSKVYDDQEIEQEVEEIQVDVDVISDPEMDSPRSNSSQNLWDISSEENRLEENHFQPQAGSHLYFFHSIMPMICEFNNDQVLDFQSAVLESIKRIKFGGNYVNITPGHTLPLLALIPAPVPAPVIKKEQPSNVVSIATNTVQQLQQIKQESDDVSKNKNSTVLQTKETLPIPSVCDKIEKCPLLKLKTNETKHMQELKQDSADLSHLQRVIYKLERISKRFVTSHFKSSYCQYGAYIESLLRGLSPRNIQYLKRNIVKEILRVKSLEKQKKSNSKKKSTQQNTCYTEMQKDDVTLSTPHTSKELSSLSNQSKDINIEIPSLRDKNNSLYQVPNNKSSDLENNNLKSLGSCSTSLKGVDSFNQNNQTNFTSSEGNMYSCQQKR
ncbi:hypothetical protein J6590_076893 [Homalodisca vitripennis]|nr:hypothetical protein J6590_076893 [Homalodisca vitripennis]